MKTNTLLMGRIGTGKTRSIETLVNCGISVRMLSLEPGVEDVLGHIPCPGLHWIEVHQQSADWDAVAGWIKKLGTLSMDVLTKSTDPGRNSYTSFFDLFGHCQHFVCQRCGEDLGCVDDWDESTARVDDGLTGLTALAKQAALGAKPFMSQPEIWGIQEAILAYIKLCVWTKCSYILLAHTDRELLSETGQVKKTVHTLGKQLAPQLTKIFSEVITATRNGNHFAWSTDEPDAETKGRRLPWSDKLSPDFGQIFKGD